MRSQTQGTPTVINHPAERKWIIEKLFLFNFCLVFELSLQPSSGLPGNPDPSISTLFPRSPQTLFHLIFSEGPSRQQEIHQAILGGRRLSSRPHLQSQRHHFQNFVTPSPQVQGRALERRPALCRPRPVPVLHSPAATAAAAAAAKVAPRKLGGGRRTCAGGRELAAPPGRCRACHQGAASCNRSRFSTQSSIHGPAPCLNSKSQPCTQHSFFSSSPAGLGRWSKSGHLRAASRDPEKPSTPGKKVDL